MTLPLGSKLGSYEVLSLLGAGGMGEVYRARDERLGRDVAVKVLASDWPGDHHRLRRFEQEARAAGALNHPNVLAVFDAGEHEGRPYVVFELLKGATLRYHLDLGALAVRRVLDYAVQIAQGLAAAHEAGIVHRDLKPENLFLTREGRVKILDFGIAKLTRLGDDLPELTSRVTASDHSTPGIVLGTVGYMSPEQVRGKSADHRSDIFSFGAVVYEMVTGQRAFQGATPADTMTAILTKDPPEMSTAQGAVSPGLERIVRRCLEKEPASRFQSAHDLAFALVRGETPRLCRGGSRSLTFSGVRPQDSLP